ncbi:MAG: ComEC/Rec2 family competence protein [Parvularculaceae bacterium]|nr:ComEC/Rec2 family competence protein [Parvularculaceae bacterium]
MFAGEAERLSLWAPVALGAGAAAYFSLEFEPSLLLTLSLLAIAIFAGALLQNLRTAFAAASVFLLGFAAADFRAAIVDAPILRQPMEFVQIEGRIRSVDESSAHRRITFDALRIENLDPEKTPARVRVTWRGAEFNAKPGDRVSMIVSLSPPPRPAAPGGFDFARQLFFQRIGAVGFAVSAPRMAPGGETNKISVAFAAKVDGFRVALARRITDKAQGESGAIVAAVITGKRGALTQESKDAFRDAGLAHLLSISGLHMGLATGLIFFCVRGLLALSEKLALTRPIKKWAAAAALFSGAGYLVLSGGAWPAQRAFIMSSIFFIAILVDRRALSLRNVAIAAFIILLLTPEAVLHPGFQMSFAAVTALIAAYEWASKRADPFRSFSLFSRLRRYAVGVAVTDTIAAIATAPFSLYHFNRAANFGLAANIISVPLMAFWVMPASILAIVLTPFNFDGPVWRLAAAGVDVMLVMARWTMALPGAVTVFPQWPPGALGVITIGGLWLCLMSRGWRFWGLAALPLAFLLTNLSPSPFLYVNEEANNVGFVHVTDKGAKSFAVFDRRRSRFDVTMWMEEAGIDINRNRAVDLNSAARCDEFGCVISVGTKMIGVNSNPMALDDDCARADLVIALYPVSRKARANCDAELIDRWRLMDFGAHSIAEVKGELSISSVAAQRGRRPWTGAWTAPARLNSP